MNAIKDKFFSIISHDLKNPAVAQRASLQLLVDNAVKFTAKGGQVTLDISPAGRDAMHCVTTT